MGTWSSTLKRSQLCKNKKYLTDKTKINNVKYDKVMFYISGINWLRCTENHPEHSFLAYFFEWQGMLKKSPNSPLPEGTAGLS